MLENGSKKLCFGEPLMPQARRRRRVFVVDDEEVIVWSTAVILRSHGFDAVPFTDPMEALQAARFEAPDLLICAAPMPLETGIELAIRVREGCPDCKVMLWSGIPDAKGLGEIWRTRGHDFPVIPKPIRPEYLIDEIQNVIGDGPPVSVIERPLTPELA